jgi:methionyl-tRNA formyltransferase
MRIGVIGCRFNTYRFLEQLKRDKIPVNCVITKKYSNNSEAPSEFIDIVPLANLFSAKVFLLDNYTLTDGIIDKVVDQNLDIIFCIGWQRILPTKILRAPSLGVLGMHGSNYKLPKGRGRSPQVWTIINGSKYYYSHIFQYDSGIDSGKILQIKKIDVTPFDTAADLQIKSQIIFNQFIKNNLDKLDYLISKGKKQRDTKSHYFKKRVPTDGLIDWELEVFKIADFVRAQTSPYPGAFCYLGKDLIRIWQCNVFDTNLDFNLPFGTIVDKLDNKEVLVQCNGGILRIRHFVPNKVKIGMRFLTKKL